MLCALSKNHNTIRLVDKQNLNAYVAEFVTCIICNFPGVPILVGKSNRKQKSLSSIMLLLQPFHAHNPMIPVINNSGRLIPCKI